MHIFLLRHGKSLGSGRYTGSGDVLLSDEGKQQIRLRSNLLSGVTFDHCFCSPMKRCSETLRIISPGCSCTYEDQIREIDFGCWEGKRFAEIAEADGDLLKTWEEEGLGFRFPGGERITDFIGRVSVWFDTLLTKPDGNYLVVTHGGVIRHGICHLLGLDQKHAYQFRLEEAGLAVIQHRDGFSMIASLCNGEELWPK